MTANRLLLVALILSGCASGVDLDEPRRLLGREGDIRVDAQMFGERINPGSLVTITYEIQNFRPTPIAFADVVAASDYDPDSRTITVTLGAEVPGTPPPRLEVIGAGEKKTFTAGARMNFLIAERGELSLYPQTLRVKVNFLSDIGPFTELIGGAGSPVDPALSAGLFEVWVENIESVMTNSIPIQWGRSMRTRTQQGRPIRP